MRKRWAILAAPAVAVAMLGAACSDEASSEGDETIEYKLAVVDNGPAVETDDPAVRRYAALLDELDPKCEGDRETVADVAVRGTQVYEEELSVDRSALEVMEAMSVSLAGVSEPGDCSAVVATLIVLERDG